MFIHKNLYNFWSRSEGVWLSKLVKVRVSLLDEQELSLISQIHLFTEAEFGVNMSCEYNLKEESGYMSWCVDSNHSGLVFTDKSLSKESLPRIFDYQMVNDHKLVMTVGKYEETVVLEGDTRRLREQRYEGKLLRRLWENKFRA